MIMSTWHLFDRAMFYLSVPKCVHCKERLEYGNLAFCPVCSVEFEEFKTRNCSVCSRVLTECDCSVPQLRANRIKRVLKVFRYIPREENLVANSLVFSLKRDNRRDVIRRAAEELMVAIRSSETDFSDWIITNVPRRPGAVVKLGFDHSAQLARELSGLIGCQYLRTLTSAAKTAQKGLHGEERKRNAVFKPRANLTLKGKRVLIVDDVITTGASMSEAARILHSLGASELVAASLSIAYKDEYVDFLDSEF